MTSSVAATARSSFIWGQSTVQHNEQVLAHRTKSGRLNWGALFCAPNFYHSALISLSASALAAIATPAAADECFHQLTREQASIERVSDGDTVVLSDQRKVRLIGINTPELNARTPTLKAYARQATTLLSQWLPAGERVWLYIGTEPKDRHSRLLAHVVRARDEMAVAPHLLNAGLAAQSAVKPNTLCANHFAELEKLAADQQLGLWENRELLELNVQDVNRNSAGFQLIQGVVSNVSTTKQFFEISFNTQFTVRVRKSLGANMRLNKLVGHTIEVRGWIGHKKNKPYLWLQHPANLRQLPSGQ